MTCLIIVLVIIHKSYILTCLINYSEISRHVFWFFFLDPMHKSLVSLPLVCSILGVHLSRDKNSDPYIL